MLVLKVQASTMLEVLAMAVQPWPKEIVTGTSGSIGVFGLRMVAEVLATAAVMENWLGTNGGCFWPSGGDCGSGTCSHVGGVLTGMCDGGLGLFSTADGAGRGTRTSSSAKVISSSHDKGTGTGGGNGSILDTDDGDNQALLVELEVMADNSWLRWTSGKKHYHQYLNN